MSVSRLCIFFVISMFSNMALGQPHRILLNNPSFEDIPRHSSPPRGWIDCGFPGESPPDVQPSGDWQVFHPAFNGISYLGLVVRENDTWEAVGQKLSSPMIKDQCYVFSIYLCRSSIYISRVKPDTTVEKNFTTAAKMRLWGGDSYCSRKQLLAESPLINNNTWQQYNFRLDPKFDHTHILIEAFYNTPTLFPYNGNLLLDHASSILQIPCSDEELNLDPPVVNILQPIEKINTSQNQVRVNARIQNVDRKNQITFFLNGRINTRFQFDPVTHEFSTVVYLMKGKNDLLIRAENPIGEAEDQTSVYIDDRKPKEEIAANESAPEYRSPTLEQEPTTGRTYRYLQTEDKTFKAGEIIAIDRLFFEADTSALDASSYPVLDEIFVFLQENSNLKVEIGGHTNGVPKDDYCDELSTARAKSVADYLKLKGIPNEQIEYKGYGKRIPIASNKTKEGRQKNQRVEIKILSIEG